MPHNPNSRRITAAKRDLQAAEFVADGILTYVTELRQNCPAGNRPREIQMVFDVLSRAVMSNGDVPAKLVAAVERGSFWTDKQNVRARR